jgi:AbrB family looped-hinge helix DNA binding protein
MRTTIDVAGRVVVPKALRDELGLTGGQELEIVVRDGRLELEPPPVAMHLEPRGDIVVAVPDEVVAPLTSALVRETLERTRR